MNLTTNLIGRKVKAQYVGSGTSGVVVAVYLDRGELWLTVENPEGGLYAMSAHAALLEPCDA